MELFDVEKYQLPDFSEVDWCKTKENLAVFLARYKVARTRIGVSEFPKLTAEYSLSSNEFQVDAESKFYEYYQEFIELHQLFVIGYSSVIHPFQPEISIRRKQVFMLRYLYGLSISLVSERIHFQKNIIIDESKIAILQFTESLSLLQLKE